MYAGQWTVHLPSLATIDLTMDLCSIRLGGLSQCEMQSLPDTSTHDWQCESNSKPFNLQWDALPPLGNMPTIYKLKGMDTLTVLILFASITTWTVSCINLERNHGQVDKVLNSRSQGLGFNSKCCICVEVSGKLRIPHCLVPPIHNGYLMHRSKVGSILAVCCAPTTRGGKV